MASIVFPSVQDGHSSPIEISIPDSTREQALHAIRGGLSGVFSQLPAIFALGGTQDPLQVGQCTPTGFWSRKVRSIEIFLSHIISKRMSQVASTGHVYGASWAMFTEASSMAPNARNDAFCASERPLIPVILSRS